MTIAHNQPRFVILNRVPFLTLSFNLLLSGRESTTQSRRGSQTKGTVRKVSDNNQWYLRTNARELQGKPTAEDWKQWVSDTIFTRIDLQKL